MGDFSAIDRATGRPVPGLTAENAGEFLTGVSREVFDRSVFLRQTGLAVSQSQELEKRISALVSSGEDDISWSEADEQLRAWQRRRRYHQTGTLPALEEEAAQLLQTRKDTGSLRQELSAAQSRAAALRRQTARWNEGRTEDADSQKQRYSQAEAELDAAADQVRRLQAQLDELDDMDEETMEEDVQDIQDALKSRGRLMGGFVFLVILLTIAAAALYILPRYELPFVPESLTNIPLLPLFLSAGIAGGLWFLVFLFAILKAIADHRDRKALDRIRTQWIRGRSQYEKLDRELDDALARQEHAQRYFDAVCLQGGPYLPPEVRESQRALTQTEAEIARIQGQLQAMGDPAAVDARLEEVREEIARQEVDYDALEVAIDALREADAQLHARFSPQLSRLAGAYFSRLTGGQYDAVSLTRDLAVTVRETGSTAEQPLATVSQGTADQLYLALRLAVTDLLLPRTDAAPLVLDDALLTFDDHRLDLALDCLSELAGDRQVILFTCQHRELDRLEGRDDVTAIRLEGF